MASPSRALAAATWLPALNWANAEEPAATDLASFICNLRENRSGKVASVRGSERNVFRIKSCKRQYLRQRMMESTLRVVSIPLGRISLRNAATRLPYGAYLAGRGELVARVGARAYLFSGNLHRSS